MSSKPYRVKIEVIVKKGNKVMLCNFRNGKWFGFPGGGVEEGDSYEETAKKECLEEVGVVIYKVRALELDKKFPVNADMKDNRAEKYAGTHKHFYVADFLGIDDSDLGGEDGEIVPYEWVSIDEAYRKVILNTLDGHGAFRGEALMKMKSEGL